MKNVQIIDGADNCTYDIFSIDDESFMLIFPNGHDIEFVDDFRDRLGLEKANKILRLLWKKRADKKTVHGIHGTLFFQLQLKKEFYPTKKESEMVVKL